MVMPPALLKNSLAIVPPSTAWTGVFRGASRSAASCGRDPRFSLNPPFIASTSTWSSGMRSGGALMRPVVGIGTVGGAARLPSAPVSGAPTRADGGGTAKSWATGDESDVVSGLVPPKPLSSEGGSGGPKWYSPHETIIPAQNAKKTTAGDDP